MSMTDQDERTGLRRSYLFIVCLILGVGWWSIGGIELLTMLGGWFALFTIGFLASPPSWQKNWEEKVADSICFMGWAVTAFVVGAMAVRKIVALVFGKDYFALMAR